MTYKDVEMISDVAMVKVDLLKDYKEKYYTRSIVAGFFIAVAMILNLVSNNIFFKAALRPVNWWELYIFLWQFC